MDIKTIGKTFSLHHCPPMKSLGPIRIPLCMRQFNPSGSNVFGSWSGLSAMHNIRDKISHAHASLRIRMAWHVVIGGGTEPLSGRAVVCQFKPSQTRWMAAEWKSSGGSAPRAKGCGRPQKTTPQKGLIRTLLTPKLAWTTPQVKFKNHINSMSNSTFINIIIQESRRYGNSSIRFL